MLGYFDNFELAKKRLISIYSGSPNLIQFIRSFLIQSNDVENILINALNGTDIDKAQGVQLDIIGKLLGIKRPTIKVGNEGNVFCFINPDTGDYPAPPDISISYSGFDSSYIVSANAFNSNGVLESNNKVKLSDQRYRTLLYAKTMFNNFSGGIDEVLEIMQFLCDGSPDITVDESIPLQPVFTIFKKFTNWELLMFKNCYSGAQPISSFEDIYTNYYSFIFPKNLGIWYTVTDINSVEFAFADYNGVLPLPIGVNKEGIAFEETSGFKGNQAGEAGGEYWTGKK